MVTLRATITHVFYLDLNKVHLEFKCLSES